MFYVPGLCETRQGGSWSIEQLQIMTVNYYIYDGPLYTDNPYHSQPLHTPEIACFNGHTSAAQM